MAISSQNLLDTTGIQLKDACVVIIKTEWNEDIIGKLMEGCVAVLHHNQISYEVHTVPGAVEIPFAVNARWKHRKSSSIKPDAFITLGCVIKGDTPHFDYVCENITQAVAILNTKLPVPTIFGVLTVSSEQQAWDRVGGSHGHKGAEAATAALKMIALNRSFKKRKR